MAASVYTFGEFRLDPGQFALTRHGHGIRIERKPFELLVLFAASQGRLVTRAEIAECLWGKEVFVDTEHGINTAVRKVRTALRDDTEVPRFVQTITGMGYRFIAEVSRVQEQIPETPQSIKETPAAAVPLQTIPTHPAWLGWRSLSLASIGLVLCATVAVAVSRHLLARNAPNPSSWEPIRSVAVLPLANYSGDPNQEYFADGMTDELITMLVRDSTLRIPSRTSVMQYKATKGSLAGIAKSLGADGILEGSVTRSSTRVHLNLQLIRVDGDSHIWAESYDRSVEEAAVLPDEAARAIAARLDSASPTPMPVRYVSPEAHEAFLRGRYLWPTVRMGESGAYFRRAAEIQPDYAEAWAWLANYYSEGIAFGVLDPRSNARLLEESAERALALDPNLAAAHLAMGAAYLISRWDLADADREILLSVHLNPEESEAYYLRACVLEAMNRFPEAIESAKESMEVDPFERRSALAEIYLGARRFDEALAEIKLRMQTAPNDPMLLSALKETWRSKGNYKEAAEAWAKWQVLVGHPGLAAQVRKAYELGGAHGFVRWELNQRLKQSKTEYVSPVELASYYAQLGDREHALALLEEAYRQHTRLLLWVPTDPAYDFLHEDSRYQELLRNLPTS